MMMELMKWNGQLDLNFESRNNEDDEVKGIGIKWGNDGKNSFHVILKEKKERLWITFPHALH